MPCSDTGVAGVAANIAAAERAAAPRLPVVKKVSPLAVQRLANRLAVRKPVSRPAAPRLASRLAVRKPASRLAAPRLANRPAALLQLRPATLAARAVVAVASKR